MRMKQVAPRAAMLIESMRDIGYTLESALADVIDNSITAGASNIGIFAETSGSAPKLAILDDGVGMSEDELLDAMRPGSRNPRDERDSKDLGRFGLGLKTASFSQCRRLTVVSRKGSNTVCARWDLDLVAEANDWLVELPETADGIPWGDQIGTTGTLILWEKLDRLSETSGSVTDSEHIVRRVDEATQHLELVFHRFLAGEAGLSRVAMTLNNRKLEAFDPFYSNHPATIKGPEERIRVKKHDVVIRTFTLPHHKKVTPAEWIKFEGRGGYLKNQGFYVYRAKRLIIHGTWFGLARQTELTKLARVRIDMPNQLDSDWKIDVKKASAQPPHQVRARLRAIIETIGSASKRVYTAKGRRLANDSRLSIWQRIQDKNEISYRVNADHPVIADFVSRLADELKQDFYRLIEMTGAAIPVDALFADASGQPENIKSNELSPDTHEHSVAAVFRQLLLVGITGAEIVEILRTTEPFSNNWSLTEKTINNLMEQANPHG
jgi:Histidine kinase-, DNA gyrase B-, and HSP90-like ATPase